MESDQTSKMPGDTTSTELITHKPRPNKKKLWLLVSGLVGVVLLLVGVVWLLMHDAKTGYQKAAEAYKQEIRSARDSMDSALDERGITGVDAAARPIFAEYGQRLKTITAAAPIKPKVLGFVPVSVSTKEVDALTKAADTLADGLLADVAMHEYYNAIVEAFKPIKNLGSITILNETKINQLAELWPVYADTVKKITPPANLEDLHANLLKQNDTIAEKVKEVHGGLATNSLATTDQLLGNLGELTSTANEDFIGGIILVSGEVFETLIDAYNALDELL